MPIKFKNNLLIDVIIRITLWSLFVFLEHTEPFERVIRPEEWWLYKYPSSTSYVPADILWMIVFSVPITVIISEFLLHRNKLECGQAFLCLTLIYGLNGFWTSFLKVTVGRPRPDFYYRCFPNGAENDQLPCTGERKLIIEGRRSFPSGHSSFSFSSLGFVSLYLAGKLQVFNHGGRGETWKLITCIFPLFVAVSIAVSRTCDYHHHWQDVTVGSLLGASIAYLCYRQYYPKLSSPYSNIPYIAHTPGMDD